MKDPDSDLVDFFRAERERDVNEAPSFDSMKRDYGREELRMVPRRRVRQLAWRAAIFIPAAAAVVLLIVPRSAPLGVRRHHDSDAKNDSLLSSADHGDLAPMEAIHHDAASVDLDQLCDAALLALDEHEAEVLMFVSTDAFLLTDQ